jgi:hypothetical protein
LIASERFDLPKYDLMAVASVKVVLVLMGSTQITSAPISANIMVA